MIYLNANCTVFEKYTYLQLNVLDQAASCFSRYDIREIAIYIFCNALIVRLLKVRRQPTTAFPSLGAHQTTECAALGRLMFQLIRYWRYRNTYTTHKGGFCGAKDYYETCSQTTQHLLDRTCYSERYINLFDCSFLVLKKASAAELFIRKYQLESYRLFYRRKKLSYTSCLQKLNISLLLERVFLNFP
ncbi:hypothetical protein T265_11426 [Opisthorchis viverrini]|uniref:Uncharacterized protein n=1 Tax=Opisthorchis viverrini TaxID=6198 RepID=A0A074Z9J1_OPIVI|nr:hypothetical protein T265_11426 [Opisthorchis viverrini]KER19915.1 hypothetical protein T265_11426 [Opisthorchis viverrini]